MTAASLLDSRWIGVVHLDRRGRIVAVNAGARAIFRRDDVLSDRDGVLRAAGPEDHLGLERLVAGAAAASGVGGWMRLRRGSGLPPLVVQVKPAGFPQPDCQGWCVAALVLIVDPKSPHRVDPGMVAAALGLTRGEGRVAAWLAEGKTVQEMAEAAGNTKGAVYWHLKRIYQKLHISRQADLVRLVLLIAELE